MFSAFAAGGHLVRLAGDDGKIAFVDLGAHEIIVKAARSVRGIDCAEVGGDLGRSADPNLPAAALPEKELEQPLGVNEVGGSLGVIGGEDAGFKTRELALVALKTDHQGQAAAGLGDAGAKGAVGQSRRTKTRVQRGGKVGYGKVEW